MLSRSAKAAAQGRAVLSPLSPLPSPYSPGYAYATPSTAAQITLDSQRHALRTRPTRKVGKSLGLPPRLEVSGPSSPKVMSPATAASMGFDASIMERLQTVLASPFSPKTFARSILEPQVKASEPPVFQATYAPPVTQGFSSNAKRVGSLKPRRKPPPTMLPLSQPTRSAEQTPLSPMRYPLLATRCVD